MNKKIEKILHYLLSITMPSLFFIMIGIAAIKLYLGEFDRLFWAFVFFPWFLLFLLFLSFWENLGGSKEK